VSLLFDLVRAEGTVRDEITAAQRVGDAVHFLVKVLDRNV
jgi:hypothetical protein